MADTRRKDKQKLVDCDLDRIRTKSLTYLLVLNP